MPDEPYCDLCDLPLAFCSHGRPARVETPEPTRPDPAVRVEPIRTESSTTASPVDDEQPAPRRPGVRVRRPASEPRPVGVPGFLEVSPEQVAHFPGCPDKGDEIDFAAWGLITRATDLAWQELGNHTPVPCDGGPRASLVAASRCETCHAHGAWL